MRSNIFRCILPVVILLFLTGCQEIQFSLIPEDEINLDIVLATAALASYENEDARRKEILDSADLKELFFLDSGTAISLGTASEYALLKSDDAVVLAFTGTNKETASQDWDENLDCALEYLGDDRDLTFRRGYIRSWLGVRDMILSQLQESGRSGDQTLPLMITGHSKGGAVAVIAAYDLISRGYNVGRVATFGAPAVHQDMHLSGTPGQYQDKISGNPKFLRLENASFHYQDEHDPVPGSSSYVCSFKTLEQVSWNLGKRRTINDLDYYLITSDTYGFSPVVERLGRRPDHFDVPNSPLRGNMPVLSTVLEHNMILYLEKLQYARSLQYGDMTL